MKRIEVVALIVLLLFLAGCKSTKNSVVAEKTNLGKLSAKKIIRKHEASKFSAKTIEARLKVAYSSYKEGKKSSQSLSVRLYIQKDATIWLKGSKIISAFKAKITPNSFSFYSPITKEYFTGDYTFLKELLGVDISFAQLQSLFLGESVWDLRSQKFMSEIEGKSYKLTPENQEAIYSIFFYFHPTSFRLKKQVLNDNNNSLKSLEIFYPNYISKNNQLFPQKISINASEGRNNTFIDIDVRSIEIDVPVSMPYEIPKGYKRIDFSK